MPPCGGQSGKAKRSNSSTMKVQVLFWSSENSCFSPLFAASHRNTGLYLLDGDQRHFSSGIVNTDLDLASFPVFLEQCFSTQSMILICDCCSSVRVRRGGVRLPDATRLCSPLTWKPPQPPERWTLQPQPRRHLRVTQDPPGRPQTASVTDWQPWEAE